MKVLLLSTFLFVLSIGQGFAQAEMSQKLRQEVYGSSREEGKIQVWVQLKTQMNFEALGELFEKQEYSIHQRRNAVLRALKSNHEQDLEQLVSTFPDLQIQENNWLGNLLVVSASISELKQLANMELVRYMELAEEKSILMEEIKKSPASSGESVNGIEPGLQAIQAPLMWKRGYSGKGRKALIMDTGLWIKHPSIQSRWHGVRKPLSESWFGFDSPIPKDKGSSHGTHVCGTVLGLDPMQNDTIGVAFGASYMGADPVSSGNPSERKGLYNIIRAFEWALDPDGDTNTIDDMPDVINNSWGHQIDTSEHICTNPFGDALEACQLAGIAIVWSAGNNGPGNQTIGAPATITRNPYLVFTVGAVDANNQALPIANFSSRGPTYCLNGKDSIKPEVVAPGVSVRSAVDSMGYANYQGTSMASPHVSGAVLLLKEAFPTLPGEKILEALYVTAMDLGPAGEENVYGNGFIRVDSAFQWLSMTNTPILPKVYAQDVELRFDSFTRNQITCSSGNKTSITVINRGNKDYAAGELSVDVVPYGGSKTTLAINQALLAGDSVTLSATIDFNPNGQSGFEAELVFQQLNNQDDPYNNTIAAEWDNFQLAKAPFRDDFSAKENHWLVQNPNKDHTWNNRFWNKDGVKFEAMQLEFFAMSNRSLQQDWLNSPIIDIWDVRDPYLEFEYAHTSKLASAFSDTLRVWVRSSCDSTWHKVFEKGGADLATRSDTAGFFVPRPNEWKVERLDLNPYNTTGEIQFRFEGVNGYGNNLYLNYIELSGRLTSGQQDITIESNILVYPNPAKRLLQVDGYEGPFEIRDIQGRLMKKGNYQNQGINIEGLEVGIYFFVAENHKPIRWIKE